MWTLITTKAHPKNILSSDPWESCRPHQHHEEDPCLKVAHRWLQLPHCPAPFSRNAQGRSLDRLVLCCPNSNQQQQARKHKQKSYSSLTVASWMKAAYSRLHIPSTLVSWLERQPGLGLAPYSYYSDGYSFDLSCVCVKNAKDTDWSVLYPSRMLTQDWQSTLC